jgi:DNA repair protein RAD16
VKDVDGEELTLMAPGIIHTLHFHRLILDEAHSIKVSVTVTGRSWANKTSRMGQTRTTGVAKACFALQANYKWCLSGTPVQNRIGEFFSLLRFLEVRPFACYFCKSCSCAEMHWSQDANRMCTHCHHR